jgi:hypothetical protein
VKDSPLDLFGQVPVTVPEVHAWLRAVARMEPDNPRAAWYVRAYDVPAKVAAAKLRGDFETITAEPPARPSPFWLQRFRWG